MHACMHACMYASMCVCVCVCMYMYVYVCMYACMYVMHSKLSFWRRSMQGYVLAAPAPAGLTTIKDLNPQYALDKVFDIRGRYGTFGKVDAITVLKIKDLSNTEDYK